MRLTFLGTGTSHGIPAIQCRCAVCCSPDPRDRRTRPSAWVRWRGASFLIDCAPELRLQAVRSNLSRVDAILLTHSHADHLFGLDDVRRFNEIQAAPLPVFGTAETLAHVRRAYDYVFRVTQAGGGKPSLELREIGPGPLPWSGPPVEAIPVFHGALEVMAFRFGSTAYVTDVSRIPSASMARLRGLEVLVLDALRWEPHPTHLTIEQAVQVAAELGARRTYFTHMAHTVAHAETDRGLPPGVRLAYDGLTVEAPDEPLPSGTP